jgi:uncharacterized membrane protein YfcA
MLPLLSMMVLCIVALMAGIMRGFSGFGGGLLIAPVYSLFLKPTDVVVLVIVLNLLTTAQLLPDMLRNIRWPIVFRLLIPALIGVPVGVTMLHLVDPLFMRRTIAAIVTAMAVLLLLGWSYQGNRGRTQDCLVGLAGGFLTSIGGVGGPPVILYLLSDMKLPPHAFRAVTLMLFFLLQILTLAHIGMLGAITKTQGIYVLVLLPVYVLAHWLGASAYRRFGHQQEGFRRIALWFLLMVGGLAFFV